MAPQKISLVVPGGLSSLSQTRNFLGTPLGGISQRLWWGRRCQQRHMMTNFTEIPRG